MIAAATPTPSLLRNLAGSEVCARRCWVVAELSRSPWGLLARTLSLVTGHEPALLLFCDFACVRWGSA